MRQIHIDVRGQAGVGKSYIMAAIIRGLRDQGIWVLYGDEEGVVAERLKTHTKLPDRFVEEFGKDGQIILTETQTQRDSVGQA